MARKSKSKQKSPKAASKDPSSKTPKKFEVHVSEEQIKNKEEQAVEFTEAELQGEDSSVNILTEDDRWDIACKLATYCEKQSGYVFFDYQIDFARRVAYSVVSEDASKLTYICARQTGKTHTIANIVDGLAIILPLIANKVFPDDPIIGKFKKGFHIGIFGPTYTQAGIMYSRMQDLMFSKHAIKVLQDPEIGIDLSKYNGRVMSFPNGSFMDVQSAAPGTKIEGKTYHLVLLEETQDIGNEKIRKSIHPMLAWESGTMVKIGTPNRDRNDFYDSCKVNAAQDTKWIDINGTEGFEKYRRHFSYDYTHACRINPKYRKYIEEEKIALGEDSDEFRMSYMLIWMDEQSRYITTDVFDKCSIKETKVLSYVDDNNAVIEKFVLDSSMQTSAIGPVVISADFGKARSSTVLTATEVWIGREFYIGKEVRYHMHVLTWEELTGNNHEVQHQQILDFIARFPSCYKFVGDATGKGDPIMERLKAELHDQHIAVVPFIFSSSSKHNGYTVLSQELYAGRVTWPMARRDLNTKEPKHFREQMLELNKTYRGNIMVVEKPQGDPKAKDDFPDSLMMACHGVNTDKSGLAETVYGNPFYGIKTTEDQLEDYFQQTYGRSTMDGSRNGSALHQGYADKQW